MLAEEKRLIFSAMSWNPDSLVPLACAFQKQSPDPLDSGKVHARLKTFFDAFERVMAGQAIQNDTQFDFDRERRWAVPILSHVVKPNDAIRRSMQLVMEARPGCGIYVAGKYPSMQPLQLQVNDVGLLVQCFRGAELDTAAKKMWPSRVRAGEWISLESSRSSGMSQSLVERLERLHGPASSVSWCVAAEQLLIRVIIPAVDDDAYDMSQHFLPELWRLVHHFLHEERRSVLFYCSAGMHRSATMLAAFLLYEDLRRGDWRAEQGMTPHKVVRDAVAMIQSARKFAMPTPTALVQLERYASVLSQ